MNAPDLRALPPAAWQGLFGEDSLARGRALLAAGKSRLLELEAQRIVAECDDGSGHYRQTIRPYREGSDWRVHGACTCEQGLDCAHVAAALLALEAQRASGQPLPTTPLQSSQPRPEPVLTLGSHVRVHYDARKGRMSEQTQHRAALAFRYAGHLLHGRQVRDLLVNRPDGSSLRIQRDAAAEASLRQRLADLGFSIALRVSEALPENAGEAFELSGDEAWMRFVHGPLNSLREQGWEVRIRPDFHFDLIETGDWYAELGEDENGQLGLEWGTYSAGERLNLLPLLLACLRQTPWKLTGDSLLRRRDDEVLLLPLGGNGHGQRVALPIARLRALFASFGDLLLREYPQDAQRLPLARADAARLADLAEGPALQWHGGEQLRALSRNLRDLGQRPAQAIPGLQASLRGYQAHGVAWMQTLREFALGGVLADDMGLGKTLQTLAHLLLEKHAGRLQRPALIVVPTSLIPNWQDEAARFAPDLRVMALQGPRRRRLFERIGECDVLLTTYALLPRDLRVLVDYEWSVLVLDEAQHIKNVRSKAAQAARALRVGQRLCLTGTPLENHLGELWALFDFLIPGWLGDEQRFNAEYRWPVERQEDKTRLSALAGRVRPFMLRRSKEQVAPELPPKTEIVQWVELSDTQRERYEALRQNMDRKVREEIDRLGLARSQIVILEALLRLRQACCDLRLLEDEERAFQAELSGKLATLMEMLEALFAEGRKVLLFSQFARMLRLIERELQRRRIPYAMLTGSTRDRATPVRQFQSGELPIFLISLKAGGTGLNLTAADTVIHFDPWWNPAAEAQASDRAHRIGQDKPVFVYKLITRGSVEERIQQMQQRKAGLAQDILDAADAPLDLNEQDLAKLLAPLDGGAR